MTDAKEAVAGVHKSGNFDPIVPFYDFVAENKLTILPPEEKAKPVGDKYAGMKVCFTGVTSTPSRIFLFASRMTLAIESPKPSMRTISSNVVP